MGPPGIRVGNFEIHPEISAKGGYDSNVFKADGEGAGAQSKVEDGFILTTTPGVTISTIGPLRRMFGDGGSVAPSAPPKLELKAGAFGTFFQYLGLTNPVTNKKQNLRGAEFDLSGDAHILPHRPVSLMLGGSWSRNARPFTASTGQQATEGGVKARKEERKSQAFNVIVPRARLLYESRGSVLTAYAGFRPTVMPFEGEAFKYLSSATYEVDAGVGWKFFPSTSLLYDMTYSQVHYYKLGDSDVDPTTVKVLISDSKRVRFRAGVNGAFTKRLSLRVLGGYAAGVFEEEALDEYELPVGEAILTYKFGLESQAEGGYTRTVGSAPVGGYLLLDRGYAKVKFVFLRTFAMTAEAGVGRGEYGPQVRREGTDIVALGAGGETERIDLRVDGLVRAEYRVASWLGLLADFVYQQNKTDFDFGSTATPDPADYQVFQVNAGLRASY